MPTFRHGRNTAFKIQTLASVLTDISNVLRDVSFPISLDTPETTAFGSTVKSYVVGIKDARFSCSGMFDATVDALFESIYGVDGPTSGADSGLTGFGFEYGPEGTTTGRIKYSGRAHLVNYQTQGSVSDMVAISVDLQVTGAITRGTWA